MHDKELLELAAKAAGVFMRKEDWPYSDPFDPQCLETTIDQDECSITGTRVWHGSDGEVGGAEPHTWNPLTDDGDALRLAVKLRITPHIDGNMTDCADCTEAHLDDPYAATRRAIVRAAAEIGKAMP